MANLGEPEGLSRALGSSGSAISSQGLIKDLLVSDSSSDLPELLSKSKEDKPTASSSSDSTTSDVYPQHRAPPSTGIDSDGQSRQPRTLHQVILDIETDLEA